ncbi:MAG TPA: hypothetical protein VJK53_04760 [Candidatus Paceibacterota bacterium]
MDSIEERVARIEQRNKAVEADKAWEVSFARRAIVSVFIYIVTGIFLMRLHLDHPWLVAFEPTVAFLISMLTMPFLKDWWVKRQKK